MKWVAHILLLLSLLFFSLSGYGHDTLVPPYAQKGVLDLTEWNFDNGEVKLIGEWEFYWHKLLTPADFNPQWVVADAYAWVPYYWSKITINGKNIPDTGYATYRLIILSRDKGKVLRLYFPPVNSSFKLWWNGQYLGVSGKPAVSSSAFIPSVHSITADVKLDYRNELIVQVANYAHREGGFFTPPVLGLPEQIFARVNISLIISAILFGAILIMSLYNFFIIFFYRGSFAAFSFFIFTFLLAVRVFIVNTDFVTSVFPNMTYDVKYRIEYFSFILLAPALYYYFYQVMRRDKYVRYALIFLLAYAFVASLTLLWPTLTFTRLLPVFQLVDIIFIVYGIYLIIRHLKRKTPGISVLAVAFLVLFAAVINDILMYMRVINTISLMPVGIFAFVLGQSLVLAKIFSDTFYQNMKLKEELEYNNIHLEDLVKKRTKELESKSRKLEKQNKLLEEQRAALEEKDYIITSSLEYASDLQSALMPDINGLSKYFDYFLLFMPRDIVSGDGFWFSDKKPDFIYIVLFDATGHGVPAAFITIIATYLFNFLIEEKHLKEPNRILDELDADMKKFLARQKTEGMDATVVQIEKDKDEPQVKFASAKMDLFYFNSRTKLVTRYRGTRRSLGYAVISKNPEKFSNTILTFHKHDVFYMTTDGFITQVDKNKHKFGTNNFMELLQKIGSEPMEEQKKILQETIVEYLGDEKQRDDISVIGIKNSRPRA